VRKPQGRIRGRRQGNSDWQKFLGQARRQGWTVSHTRNGHLKLSKPGRRPLFLSVNTTDPRAIHNMRAFLARSERGAP
jgi:hypothetical protein